MLNKTLSPQVPTVIDIQLNNPLDTNTYFAKSVVSDKVSGATLYTVKLTDKGNQYFKAPWTTPTDPTGNGRELLVATTIYTDSDYTQVSPSYGSTYDTWIIRAATQFLGGGGGGAFIDYDLIKKLIKEAWDEMPSTDIPETDMKPFESLIQGLSARIDDLAADEDEDEGEEDGESQADEVKEMLAQHMEGVSQLLGDHAIKMQQIMGSLFAHHSEVLDDMRGLVGKMDEASSGGDEARTAHMHAIVSLLEKHKSDVLDGVHDAVDGLENRPVMLSLREATQKPPEKKGLRGLLS